MLPPRLTAHLAHASGGSRSTAMPANHPATQLDVDSPQMRELLEALDDAIFTAIAGCRTSLDKSRELWPAVVSSVAPAAIEESREQYLRYAIEASTSRLGIENRSENGALAALEIIEMLTRG